MKKSTPVITQPEDQAPKTNAIVENATTAPEEQSKDPIVTNDQQQNQDPKEEEADAPPKPGEQA